MIDMSSVQIHVEVSPPNSISDTYSWRVRDNEAEVASGSEYDEAWARGEAASAAGAYLVGRLKPPEEERTIPKRHIEAQLQAEPIIRNVLTESTGMTAERAVGTTQAIIARLARRDILLAFPHELKDE